MSFSDFEKFERFLFDRKESKAGVEWYFREDFDPENVPFANYEVIRLSSVLFLNIQDIAQRYSEIQISRGLQFLIWNCPGKICYVYGDEAIDYNERCYAIRSMFNVFSTLFNKKLLSDEYDQLCFMWWEAFPYPSSPAKDVDYVIIETLGEILKLGSVECVQSALNGLRGCSDYGTVVAETIQRNMENIPAQLRSEALELF